MKNLTTKSESQKQAPQGNLSVTSLSTTLPEEIRSEVEEFEASLKDLQNHLLPLNQLLLNNNNNNNSTSQATNLEPIDRAKLNLAMAYTVNSLFFSSSKKKDKKKILKKKNSHLLSFPNLFLLLAWIPNFLSLLIFSVFENARNRSKHSSSQKRARESQKIHAENQRSRKQQAASQD